MDTETFRAQFKEELNTRYESHATKWDKNDRFDEYLRGKMDEIDSIEILFDKIWKKYIESRN